MTVSYFNSAKRVCDSFAPLTLLRYKPLSPPFTIWGARASFGGAVGIVCIRMRFRDVGHRRSGGRQ